MAPPSTNRPRSGPALAALVVLLVLIFGGIVAKAQFGKGEYVPRLGLDLAGGTTVTLQAQTPRGTAPKPDQMTQAVNIIRERVNGIGIGEATVTQQGDSIIVQVPGKGQGDVVNQVGRTAQLYFRQVLLAGPGATVPTGGATPSTGSSGGASAQPSGAPSGGSGGETASGSSPSPSGRVLDKALTGAAPSKTPTGDTSSGANDSASPQPSDTAPDTSSDPARQGIDADVLKAYDALDCTKKENRRGGGLENPNAEIVACDRTGAEKFVLGKSEVLGTSVTKATAQSDPQSFGEWKVVLDFNGEGTRQFAELTTKASKETDQNKMRIAIELDHVVVSAPAINQGPIVGGQAEISGKFTQTDSTDLANVLKYGSLPLSFKALSIESVSPTLGGEQLRGGLLAGTLGLALVVVYAFLYYRGLGLVAIASLVCSAVLTFGSVVLLSELAGYRLSLAGIAGLIVAIGITADSFIIYFERLRDEVREGRTLRQATERGWTRARRTILTADAVSFLAAVILYIVSVDQVKGFAFTLGLTTLIDVIVVFLFTKPIMSALVRTSFFGGGHRLSGLDPTALGAANRGRAVTRTAVRRA